MNVSRTFLVVAALVVGSLPGHGMHAQSLGGLINKAKDKANAKTSSGTPAAAAQAAGGVGLDDSGHPRSIRPESASTPAKERALVAAIMNDPKPGSNEDHKGEEYQKLKAETGFAPIYSADDGFFTKVPNFENRANYYIDWIDEVSSEFRRKSVYLDAVTQALPKIKEIHFVGTGEDVDQSGPTEGWKFAWDKNTGTLSIFFGKHLQTWSYNRNLAAWVAQNVK